MAGNWPAVSNYLDRIAAADLDMDSGSGAGRAGVLVRSGPDVVGSEPPPFARSLHPAARAELQVGHPFVCM